MEDLLPTYSLCMMKRRWIDILLGWKKPIPLLMLFTPASLLITQFERIGLVKNNEFLQSVFKLELKPITTFTDNQHQVFKLEFFNENSSGKVHFKIASPSSSIDMNTHANPLQNLDYAFLDIIPGGNKELVYLDEYYIINGFNFVLKV